MSDLTEPTGEPIYDRDKILSQVSDLLQIEDEGERSKKTTDFIERRLKVLTDNSIPRRFYIMSKPLKGFLHPKGGVKRNAMVDLLMVDDPNIYKLLLETFKEFKDTSGWKDKSLREIAPRAILRTIGNYFGNHWGTSSTEAENRSFYLDRIGPNSKDIHLDEIKGKGIAVCAEKAAVAQNLLSFLGYSSELVASSKCRLQSSEKDDEGGHIYNVITNGDDHLIFDPANPILLSDDNDDIYSVMPCYYHINQEEYKKLMTGGRVEVIHNDGLSNGGNPAKGEDIKRIYGGPSKASL